MKETITNLKKVYNYGKDKKISLILEIIGSIIGIIINIILPILSAKLIVYLTDSIWNQLIITSLIVLAIDLISNLKTVLIRKNTQIFFKTVSERIQKDLAIEILKINQTELDSTSSGTFIQRMTTDPEQLSSLFTKGIGYLTGVISSIGIFIAIFIINKIVFFYYLATAIILSYLHILKSRKITIKEKQFREKREKVTGLIGELIRGVRDIKMLNAKTSFISTLNKNIVDQNESRIDTRNVDIFYNFIINTLSNIFEFSLILLLVYLVYKNTITASIAIALFSYRFNVMTNLMDKVSLLLEEITNFNISANRVFSILENKKYKKEKFGKKHLNHIEGNFEFDNVTFGYNKDIKVLDGLSFKIKANQTVGFVGKSGAGKTTIFNLLCKMYDIDNGTIKIDGININELDEDSIRGNITIIGQNPYIFNMSIKDNLKLVKDNLTEEEMIEACKIACLDDFINTLPDKYDTKVGEGGVTLSGGQKQRLAIARAFIQKTEIILFDEATSALDNETQSKIQQAIDNLKNEYTILIIAHRLSTIINCDKIMILEDGKITSIGNHHELIKTNNTYKKLCETELSKE